MKDLLRVTLFFLAVLILASCEGKGKLVIKEPPNADVYINGEHVGKTPIELELKEAKYNITVATSPFDLETKKGVQIYFDHVTELKFNPTPKGILVADSKPQGAQVLENKELIGVTPLEEKIDVGEHHIIFKLGAVGTSRVVNIEYGKPTKIFVNLEKAVIHFNGIPQDAVFYIDGKKIGSFPKTVELDEGLHRITIEKGVYRDSFTLKVKKGDEFNVRYVLEDVQLPPIQAYGPISFTPDRKYLVTMGKAGIYFWDIKKFKPQISLYDPKDVRNFDKFINFGISENGEFVAGIKPIRKLAYALKDKTKKYDKILVWDMKTTFPVLSKLYPMESIAVFIGNDKLYFITKDGYIKIADFKTGEIKEEISIGDKPTVAKYDKGIIFIGTESGKIVQFDTAQRSKTEKRIHQGKVNSLEISFDRKFIVTASSDGKVAILDKDLNNQKIFEFGSEILSANISPENKKIAVGKPDRTVDVIDINSGETLYSIDGLKAPVISLAFSNEDILITASSIKTPRVNIWKNGHLLRKWIQTVE
ncbi:MAG TPA: PEGA domain-containing protein [Persephonella sp.]|uniref:PEGA domain family protein n=1 Tax=Persephonella marina (strain DSM 14350 / EX-H1) TaxID=123214 RepID=C0QQ40_PERMH|nr:MULTISPECIES: PEGA domain-containing protein [Persephonella]ACO04747.1 PEGA domain family protein [Persephonella marina EX-H1]HCB69599.1 PEGA domain-containing protein [Persephonella sp.]